MRQFDNDKDGKISFLEFKFEYTQRMSSTHNNYFESKQPTKPKQEKIEETIVQSEENSENIKKSTLKKKNSNDQSKLKQEKEDTEFERDQNSVIIEKSLKTSFNESSITKPKIKQENDHIEYQSERKSIFVEKSIKSSIKKKSFAQPILNEKKEPVVFDDPDDPDKVSFLEYKHTKVGISPDLKESSNNDTTKLNKGIELKSTIEIEDGDKSKEESVINLSKKEDSNGEDSEDK